MSHVRVDSSVPRHRKFQQAGPAPSWLWLCGLAYCQEGLTDGFIPVESIDYLGVKNATRLASHLVKAGLWEKVDGGWQVHDYLKHNRSAMQVNGIKKNRRESGRIGGVASGHARRSTDPKQPNEANSKQDASTDAKQHANPYVPVDVPVGVVSPDLAFSKFQDAYPPARRKGGYLVQQLFVQAYERLGDRLFEILENHKASEQWSKPNLIPGMDVWFKEERWRQSLPSAAEADRAAVNAKLPAWARR